MDAARVYFVAAVLLLMSLVLSGRVLFLQLVDRDFLQDQGDARTIRFERINAHRGMVQDRHGKPLAISSPVGSLWANPNELLLAKDRLPELAKALGIEAQEFLERINNKKHRSFVYLRRHLTPAEVDAISSLEIPGVYTEREYHRFYPAGEITAHVVGFTNIDDKGQEGVELAFDEWLKGRPGKKKVLKNLYGQIVKDIKPVVEAQPGRTLTLSIDLRIQYLAYRELKIAMRQYQAVSGSIVILDVATGEILAMVNQPSFNPNNRTDIRPEQVRNRAVTDVFEPGSTVKPLTVAAALQSDIYTPFSEIDTHPGFIRVGNKTIRDPSNRGLLRIGEVIAKSSQVGITKIALSINEQDIWKLFSAVGFGRSTESGFPGESSGFLPNHRSWKDIDRATFAYGYGLNVTPLQLAGAYLVLASGGYRRQPSLVRGSEVRETRVMDPVVAGHVLAMLKQAVDSGTGTRAKVTSYTVAGKTGTVRKVGRHGYQDTHHLTFFAGITPASNPKLVGVVLIDDPSTKKSGGGTIAAPVFSRIMGNALRLLNVAPDDPLKAVGDKQLKAVGDKQLRAV